MAVLVLRRTCPLRAPSHKGKARAHAPRPPSIPRGQGGLALGPRCAPPFLPAHQALCMGLHVSGRLGMRPSQSPTCVLPACAICACYAAGSEAEGRGAGGIQ